MNRERLQIATLKKTMLSCIVLAIAPIGLLAQTARIHVRVIDGRTGKNLSGRTLTFVDYHNYRNGSLDGDLNGRKTVKASADGDSYIANPDAHGVLVFEVLGIDGAWRPCTRQKFYDRNARTYGNEYLYPVSTIMASGLVAKNDCRRRTATAGPGELIIFIRPTTWRERFIEVFE